MVVDPIYEQSLENYNKHNQLDQGHHSKLESREHLQRNNHDFKKNQFHDQGKSKVPP